MKISLDFNPPWSEDFSLWEWYSLHAPSGSFYGFGLLGFALFIDFSEGAAPHFYRRIGVDQYLYVVPFADGMEHVDHDHDEEGTPHNVIYNTCQACEGRGKSKALYLWFIKLYMTCNKCKGEGMVKNADT